MSKHSNPIWEYRRKPTDWADGWAVTADAVKFAARFNTTVPGAYRNVTPDDIRHMARCGLVGRCGFFHREDLETVRGVLQYEQLRSSDETTRLGRDILDAVGKQRP